MTSNAKSPINSGNSNYAMRPSPSDSSLNGNGILASFKKWFYERLSVLAGLVEARNSSKPSLQNACRVVYFGIIPPFAAIDNYSQSQVPFYSPNFLKTTRYTIWTFLPRNLLEQLSKVANLYFLMIIVLQSFPQIRTANASIAALPLLAIVAVTAAKDAFEDYKRFVADKALNDAPAWVLQSDAWANLNHPDRRSWWRALLPFDIFKSPIPDDAGAPIKDHAKKSAPKRYITKQPSFTVTEIDPSASWSTTTWSNVCVGDFVLLKNNDPVPADMILIAGSESNSTCYVETKSLDGETNLKLRVGVPNLGSISTPEKCTQLKFAIESEAPSPSLYTYFGTLIIDEESIQRATQIPPPESSAKDQKSPSLGSMKHPLGPDNILLRGCILRNCSWAIGAVVYTGDDTKVVLNAGATPTKRTRIDRALNPLVLLNFTILGSICLTCGILSQTLAKTPNIWGYLNYNLFYHTVFRRSQSITDLVTVFFSCLVVFQNIVPISLYLTVEFLKTIQSVFIWADRDIEYRGNPCLPRTWNISDDLGQIEYVFSDKTGTLTQNIMQFRQCYILGANQAYGACVSTNGPLRSQEFANTLANPYMAQPPVFHDLSMMRDICAAQGAFLNTSRHFWLLLSSCHTVVPEMTTLSNHEISIAYQAQSPDEAALVAAARDSGFVFLRRNGQVLDIWIWGKEKSFTLLNILEFTSARKRMSTVVKDDEGSIWLYCKGADATIFERLASGQTSAISDTTQALQDFASNGLRTLCLAYRPISAKEYSEFSNQYHTASLALDNREARVEAVCDAFERNLLLLGATAIEDKLQDGVPKAIEVLSRAGINLWVLTGDKVETAINIGSACNLITPEMTLIQISTTLNSQEEPVVDTETQICNALTLVGYTPEELLLTPMEIRTLQLTAKASKGSSAADEIKRYVLVIDGDSLTSIFSNVELKQSYLRLCMRCQHVLCCRVSPLQKAQVVALVRHSCNAVTLAIGDGANDVSMIQEADIGVGISGEEGMQAVLSSDYAVGQFRYLVRLVLVHGRWSNMRISSLVCNFFYKNMTWVFIMFWYQFWSGFSAELMYDYTFLMLYNLIFTQLPVFMIGMFDKDLPEKICLFYPEVYTTARRRFTTVRFLMFVADAVYQSLVCFYIPFFTCYHSTSVNTQGMSPFKYESTTSVAVAAVIAVNLNVMLSLRSINWVSATAIFASMFSLPIYIPIYSLFKGEFNSMVEILYLESSFWATIAITVAAALLPRLVILYLCNTYAPGDIQIMREISELNLPHPARPQGDAGITASSTHHERPLSSLSMKRTSFLINAATKSKSERTGYAFAQEAGMASMIDATIPRSIHSRCAPVHLTSPIGDSSFAFAQSQNNSHSVYTDNSKEAINDQKGYQASGNPPFGTTRFSRPSKLVVYPQNLDSANRQHSSSLASPSASISSFSSAAVAEQHEMQHRPFRSALEGPRQDISLAHNFRYPPSSR